MRNNLNSDKRVRVRYAPSPTGEPHVGNIRTALFDWIIAKKFNGDFIVRVEDTDQDRKVEGAIDLQKSSLMWLGLEWDEGLGKEGQYGPYVQSERLDIYLEHVNFLISNDKAYKCFCTPERLEEVRKQQRESKSEIVGYDGFCRQKQENYSTYQVSDGCVVRFKMPQNGESTLNDLVRNQITFENRLIEDFVIIKSDGFPTYHFASVIDDHLMEISLIVRGEEWLSSLPRHIQIHQAFDWDIPDFAHIPTILAPDKTKLSKRHGATSVLEFKKEGYLPEAMINFLCLLGWSIDGEQELISIDDLIQKFNITELSPSGSVFDKNKLNWMNGQYIKRKTPSQLAKILYDFWVEFPPESFDFTPSQKDLEIIVPLISERLKTLREAEEWVAFLYKNQISYTVDDLIQKKSDIHLTNLFIEKTLNSLNGLQKFDSDSIENHLRDLIDELEVKPGMFLGTIRMATSGQKVSPPLFESLEILGRVKTINLLKQADHMIKQSINA